MSPGTKMSMATWCATVDARNRLVAGIGVSRMLGLDTDAADAMVQAEHDSPGAGVAMYWERERGVTP